MECQLTQADPLASARVLPVTTDIQSRVEGLAAISASVEGRRAIRVILEIPSQRACADSGVDRDAGSGIAVGADRGADGGVGRGAGGSAALLVYMVVVVVLLLALAASPSILSDVAYDTPLARLDGEEAFGACPCVAEMERRWHEWAAPLGELLPWPTALEPAEARALHEPLCPWEPLPAAHRAHYRASDVAWSGELPSAASLFVMDAALAGSWSGWRHAYRHECGAGVFSRDVGGAPRARSLYAATVDAVAQIVEHGGYLSGTVGGDGGDGDDGGDGGVTCAPRRCTGYLARWAPDRRWLAVAVCDTK